MQQINVGQLLGYLGRNNNPDDRIQIVSGGQDWEQADEVNINSKLLDSFSDWTVLEMECRNSYMDHTPVIRISIGPSLPKDVHDYACVSA